MRILVEVKVTTEKLALDEEQVRAFNRVGFFVEEGYTPVPLEPEEGGRTMVIRGEIEEGKMKELRSLRGVVGAWEDTTFAPFESRG
jgi:hypothetical protein